MCGRRAGTHQHAATSSHQPGVSIVREQSAPEPSIRETVQPCAAHVRAIPVREIGQANIKRARRLYLDSLSLPRPATAATAAWVAVSGRHHQPPAQLAPAGARRRPSGHRLLTSGAPAHHGYHYPPLSARAPLQHPVRPAAPSCPRALISPSPPAPSPSPRVAVTAKPGHRRRVPIDLC
jgi:hypothetical protein